MAAITSTKTIPKAVAAPSAFIGPVKPSASAPVATAGKTTLGPTKPTTTAPKTATFGSSGQYTYAVDSKGVPYGNPINTSSGGSSGGSSSVVMNSNIPEATMADPKSVKVKLPEVEMPDYSTYDAILKGAQNQYLTSTEAQNKMQDLATKNSKDEITKMFRDLTTPNYENIYAESQQGQDITGKQKVVGDLTAQLGQITSQGQSMQQQVVGQGRGIPEAIIGGQQAQIARETAIQALPIAAQLAAAQGNLEMAQSNVDKLYKIKSDTATAKYTQQREYAKAFMEVANAGEKAKLDIFTKQLDRQYTKEQQDLKDVKDIYSQALSNGAPQSVLSKLDSATNFSEAVKAAGKYGGDYLKSELLRAQIANTNASADKTRAEKDALGTPGAGKPATDTQIQNAGYATRIKQANDVIDKNASTLKDLSFTKFKMLEANSSAVTSLLSPEEQQVAQAMRNFITAKLRKESGAAISPTEFTDARLQYFPQYGDSDAVIKQKKQTRDDVLANNIQGAGSAYTPTATATSSNKFSTALGQSAETQIPGASIIQNITPTGELNFNIPINKK